MKIEPSVIEIIRIFVTVVSTIITGISAYLLYKSRYSPLRETLYSKQLDIYIELVDTLFDFYINIDNLIEAKSNKEVKRVELLQKEAMEKGIDFVFKYKKGMAVIPLKIREPFLKLIDKADNTLSGPFKIDKGKELRDSIKKVIQNIYDTIGTKPLSIETHKLIKKIKS